MHRFLCGCQMPTRERLQGDPELTSLDTVIRDAEGFLICSVHHVRRSGWRVPSHRPMDVSPGITDLEYERWVLYGEEPPKETLDSTTLVSVHARFSSKDNRDPVEDYDAIMIDVINDRADHLSKRTVGGNGHGPTHVAFQNGKPIMYGGEAKPTVVHRSGNEQMRYQRELAQAQVISKSSTELHKRETGF